MKASDITEDEVLLACDAFHLSRRGTRPPDETLPYPRRVILAKMEKMVKKGLLDYGVSLRTAWRR